MPPLPLRPGDVLLHAGTGEISKLIAWASNSVYSHCALVLDADTLIESAANGVATSPLATRLADTTHFTLIDAWRWGGSSGQIAPDALAAMQARARSALGDPYPLDALFELGVVCAVRDAVDWPPHLHWLIRVALDHVVHLDPSRMVCSEFVYRCFAEAATVPPGALCPVINVLSGPTRPFPQIDWAALVEEYLQALRYMHHAPPPPESPGRALASPREALAVQAAAARAHRAGAAPRGGMVEPHPNADTVTPQDFANSPSFGLLGRVLPAPHIVPSH